MSPFRPAKPGADHLGSLFCWHAEFVEGLSPSSFHHLIPIGLGDVQSAVGPPSCARPVYLQGPAVATRRQSTMLLLEPGPSSRCLGRRRSGRADGSDARSAEEVVADGGQRVVSAEALIQGLLLLRGLREVRLRMLAPRVQSSVIRNRGMESAFSFCAYASELKFWGFLPSVCRYGPGAETDWCGSIMASGIARKSAPGLRRQVRRGSIHSFGRQCLPQPLQSSSSLRRTPLPISELATDD